LPKNFSLTTPPPPPPPPLLVHYFPVSERNLFSDSLAVRTAVQLVVVDVLNYAIRQQVPERVVSVFQTARRKVDLLDAHSSSHE